MMTAPGRADLHLKSMTIDDVMRFMSRVDRTPGGCWTWRGTVHHSGYGVFALPGRRQVRAHRAAYFIATDELPGDHLVCHRCDNPRCVNPGHMFLGSSADNKNDSVAKRRHGYGARNGRALLTDAKVTEIRSRRAAGATLTAIASAMGLTKSLVADACSRTWKHIA